MTARPENELRDHSTGELLKQLSNETTTLVRQEIELMKAELAAKAKPAGIGAGMFGGAGLFGLGAFLTLTAFFVALLDGAMAIWLAALIVAVVYAAIAGVLALQGKQKVKEATPVAPEQTMESVKEDVQWAKTQAKSGMT
jgi:ABC-type multidrug transport system fused ATPase/permease subunit